MALNNAMQWLLGFSILVLGAFMLFGRAEEPETRSDVDLPIAPENIPSPPADLPIKRVDAETKACMADMACMQEFFLKVTLGNEYQPSSLENARVRKWLGPINYRVYGWDRLNQAQLDAMEEGLANITKIASLVDVDLIRSTRAINAVVLITSDVAVDLDVRFSSIADRAFRPIPGFVEALIDLQRLSTICAAMLGRNSNGSLSFVGMYLSPEIDHQTLKRCVYEEFSQMLGLVADVADDIDSLYTDQAHRRELTEFDFFLLRLLYHPQIIPGMSRDQVIQVFPDVYRQVIATPVTD